MRYISGKATTMEAKMALYQFITSFTPKCSMKKMPSGLFAPNSSSRKYPTTVGGSTMGRVSTTSSTPLSTRGSFAM